MSKEIIFYQETSQSFEKGKGQVLSCLSHFFTEGELEGPQRELIKGQLIVFSGFIQQKSKFFPSLNHFCDAIKRLRYIQPSQHMNLYTPIPVGYCFRILEMMISIVNSFFFQISVRLTTNIIQLFQRSIHYNKQNLMQQQDVPSHLAMFGLQLAIELHSLVNSFHI